MITSSVPKKAKTTTGINLALTMANAGKMALFVDTDLKTPYIYKIFKHDLNRGLTNIYIDAYTSDLANGNLLELK